MSTSVVINRLTGQVAKLSSVKQVLKRKGLELNLETLNRFYSVPSGKTAVMENGVIRLFNNKTAQRRIEEQKQEVVEFIQAPKRNARVQERKVIKKFFDNYTRRYLEDTPDNRRMVSDRDLVEYQQIETYVQNSQIKKNKPFVITLKAPHSDKQYEFRFNNIEHLEGALKLDEGENYLGNKYAVDMKQYFEHAHVVSLKNIEGGCNRNKKEGDVTKVKGTKYEFTIYCPLSKDNSCAYKAIEYHTKTTLSNKNICQALKLDLKAKKSIKEVVLMWNYVSQDPAFHVIHKDYSGEMEDGHKYILLKDDHYSAITSHKLLQKEVKDQAGAVRHQILTWDCETRPTEEYITIRAGCKDANGKDISYRSYKLKDTITSIAYMGNRGQMETKTFTSTADMSSSRQFIDWLKQSNQKFRCYAHNAASFDNYFFLQNLTEEEFQSVQLTKLGLRFAKIKFEGHELTDSRLHLVQSLDSLCKDYRVKTPKLTEFEYNGRVLTNKEMCFYKPELSFEEFLKLQETEPKFWSLYQKYCEIDCKSLYEVWVAYSISMRQIAEAMLGGDLKGHSKDGGVYNVANKMTVGSGAMKLLEASCVKHNKNLYLRAKDFNDTHEKEDFLRKFIRGGISHTGQPGAHHYKITDVDIASQYPSAMYFGRIPVGTSRWIGEGVSYNKKWCGYVQMKNVVFSEEARKNKFIATYLERDDGTRVLQWDTPNVLDELYLDTIAINYYLDTGLLKSFDVVKGLVSNQSIQGKELYGLYIDTLFSLKAKQDEYKNSNSAQYNPSMRSSIKLLLNSVSGKCIENKLKYEKLCSQEKSTKTIRVNGHDLYLQEDASLNSFLPTGLSIYSNSKILLREYVECLPNGADDMIHAETDGFMFKTSSLEHFKHQVDTYKERIPKGDIRETLPIAFGQELGNIGVACETDEKPSYFLGKKNYLMSGADKGGADLIRLKGIPQKTINADGSDRKLVSRVDYEKMFSGEKVSFTFPTLLKTTKEQVCISTHMVTRSIKLDSRIFSEHY
jgi:hypothetical protein